MNILKRIKRLILKLNFHEQFWTIWCTIAIAILIIFFFLWLKTSDVYNISDDAKKTQEYYFQIIAGLGGFIWWVISFIGLSIGLWLAIWGRIIQYKSHLQDRYEKASAMLGNEVMPVRIAGCRALMSLGKEDKSMKAQCVRLLFAFINNPYLKSEYQGKSLDRVFPYYEFLRDDIKEAANSFSAIYNYYGDIGIDKERVVLPHYFLVNIKQYRVSLIKANLVRADLQKSYLLRAILRKAKLWEAKLQKADLREAKLQEANLRRANLRKANLGRANLREANLAFANLRKANLKSANLQGADLINANLRKANLSNANLQKANCAFANLQNVNFSEANLEGAEMEMADITDAKLKFAKNLTKEEMLFAIWGIDEKEKGSPPSLPDELKNDPEVQNWLANPHYNKKELAEEFAKVEIE